MNVIFLNVDTQKDFMDKEGKLYVDKSEDIRDNLRKLTKLAENMNLVKVNTADWHTVKSAEISVKPDLINTFPLHCIAGTEGADFIEETEPRNKKRNYYIVDYNAKDIDLELFNRAKDIIIHKDNFNVFSNSLSNKVFGILEPYITFVYGVTTNICVNYAVLGLIERGFTTVVVMDAIKELPNCNKEVIFDIWRNQGVILETTENVVKKLPKLLI